ncbi:hypothetical protein [Corynebacterium cystitidis]|uniref:hypothetical protein n=1 Tax=Corynebacterium cystitidis TaxID=35757 RepID=UPI00211F4524|nr:hypothetical protein [Corynebacterium cystitidis]
MGVFVIDTGPLSHAAQAGVLDVLDSSLLRQHRPAGLRWWDLLYCGGGLMSAA